MIRLAVSSCDGSHVAVEGAVSAQFAVEIPAFVKPIFERLRRTRHTAQYFDLSAAARLAVAWTGGVRQC
jgi:hypothetical protein